MNRIHQIKLNLGQSVEIIPEKILKKIGGRDLFIKEWRIVKESIDARDKSAIKLVYSVDFNAASLKHPEKTRQLPANPKVNLEIAPNMEYHPAATDIDNAVILRERPVVVGLGPAGLFAGLVLAQAGYKPLIIERGQDVDSRSMAVKRFWEEGILDTESNVQFGEGGAGTFSDGKLTTGIKDSRIRKVLEEMVAAGAPEDVLYKQKPHIGTDVLRHVVKAIRSEIIRLGGRVKFSTRMDDIVIDEKHQVAGIIISERGKSVQIPTQVIVSALGHSARDTFRWMNEKKISMSPKPFSIGVRIEHPQEIIDIAQYGKRAAELGLAAADYKLNHRCENGRGVYTFCMCPGGHVIQASSQEGGVVTNGMSYHDRDSGTANSALLCDVRVSDFQSDDVLAGVEFQEKYERLAFLNGGSNYQIPKSTWGELRDGKAPHVEGSLPSFAVEAMREAMPHLGRRLKGFDREDAVVSAVESRSSSPVRFERGENMEGRLADSTALKGFYPCGEGAGYAGGIMSAAVDGIKAAESVIKNWKLED